MVKVRTHRDVSTSIEITDSHVKLLQAKTQGRERVVSFCQIKAMVDFTDEEIARLLRDLAISATVVSDQLIVSIPRRLTILKQLKLPSLNESEIKKMVSNFTKQFKQS